MTRILTATVVLLTSGFATAQQPGPNSDAKVAALLAAWEKKRNELPVLRYTYTQKQTWTPEFSASPTGDTLTEERELKIDWKTGRYRLERIYPGDEKRELESNTQVFDGKTMKAITTQLTSNRQPIPGKAKGYLNDGHLPSLGANEATFHLPYISVGLLPNTGASGSYSEKLYPPSPEGMLYFSRSGRRNGVMCDIYATFPRGARGSDQWCEVTVDPAREQCVLKFETFVGKSPGLVYQFEYAISGNHLLPSKWTMDSYKGGKLITSLKADVRAEPVHDAPSTTFEMSFPEGLPISHVTVPQTKGKRASVTIVDAIVKDGSVVDLGSQGNTDHYNRRLLVLISLWAICIGMWLGLRRRRRSECTPVPSGGPT
jgi:hypothetical protein